MIYQWQADKLIRKTKNLFYLLITEFVFIFFLSDSSRKQSVIIHTGAWDGLGMREYKSYIILFTAKNILSVCAQGDYYC